MVGPPKKAKLVNIAPIICLFFGYNYSNYSGFNQFITWGPPPCSNQPMKKFGLALGLVYQDWCTVISHLLLLTFGLAESSISAILIFHLHPCTNVWMHPYHSEYPPIYIYTYMCILDTPTVHVPYISPCIQKIGWYIWPIPTFIRWSLITNIFDD